VSRKLVSLKTVWLKMAWLKMVWLKMVWLKMVWLKLPWPGVRAGYMQARIYAGGVHRYRGVSILRYRPQPAAPIRTGEESR
jgi:hypothetical protein